MQQAIPLFSARPSPRRIHNTRYQLVVMAGRPVHVPMSNFLLTRLPHAKNFHIKMQCFSSQRVVSI
ncbi:hypothetical protein C7443_10731 [Plasticicumulans acidivorans]|uniref:Uncharacterized protein n=1 Tax=Plasticicumulans acidivorans TaxID=886464 RepID=A0A317MT08_9GAMM|nr:hypothetical protein C7443_10731 [Plasticicumulans acidivorans]